MLLVWILIPVALVVGLGSGYIIRKQIIAKQGKSLEAKTQKQIEGAEKKK